MNSWTSPVDIRPDHLAIVQEILRAHLPAGFKVWVFGSRANWTTKDSSDLDLAVEGAVRLDHKSMIGLEVAFEESDLPYTVDVVDLKASSPEFKRIVEDQKVPIGATRGQSTYSDEWEEKPFQEVIDFREGPGILAKDFREDGVPLVRLAGLIRGASVLEGCNYLDPESVVKRWDQFRLELGDVLLSTSASLGRIAVVGEEGIGAIPYTGIIRMRPRYTTVHGPFIRYLLEGPDFQQQCEMVGVGSVIRHFGPMHLRQMTLKVPPLPDQRAIAHVLGTLDDKIELNWRMNRTLEEMARTLFQDWFVDFGPTRAKMEGQDPYLPPELWGLFPDKLVDSELGEIPEGWEIKPLGEIIELAYGKALKAGDRKGGTVPVYGSNGQVGWHDVKLVSGPGIIVGRKGNPGTVTWSHEDFFPIDTAFYVVPESPDPALHFLHYALIDQDLPSMAADSAVPGLNRNLAYMNDQLVPKRSLMEIYDSYVEKLFIRMHLLEKESHDLTLLRDTLLPRLLSGEIKIEEG